MRKLYLHILQLEGYEPGRFLAWLLRNLFTRKVENKKPLVWTAKATFLYYASLFLALALPAMLSLVNITYAFALFLIFVIQPWTTLLLALLLMKPYEIVNRQRVIEKTRVKIQGFQGLQVIGIAGSYGKTSVKEVLYQLLRKKYKVLRTPKSYNTVFGIAKVVDLELDKNYDFFICEMGAYKKGDIAELCQMVGPKHGILTGIAEQHLERFGSLENIVAGKFELIESLPRGGEAVLNGDNEHIVANAWRAKSVYRFYGVENEKSEVRADDIKYSDQGSEFTVTLGKDSFAVQTKLLGKGNVQNILGAVALAKHLGLSIEELKEAIKDLEPIPNRLELIKRNGNTIVNDSYSSNPEGFKESIEVVRQIKANTKVLITPGIVELGSRTKEVHEDLAKAADGVFDRAILVGETERTKPFADSLEKTKYQFVKSTNDALAEMEKLKDTLVLIENDLPDNY